MRNEAEKFRKIQQDLLVEIDEREVEYKKQLEDREQELEMSMLELLQSEKRRFKHDIVKQLER
jgi:hypothetical protein